MTAPAQQELQILTELDASARIGHDDYVRLRDVLAGPAPADDTVERAARAWHEAAEEDCGGHFMGAWEAIDDENRDRARRYMRAALAAARGDAAPTVTAVAAVPPLRAPFAGGDPRDALKAARGVIEDAIVNHPRSQQVEIGPSEIGTPCEHCLAAKLAGWPQVRDVAWLPTIGTALHAWVEEAFIRHENSRGAQHDGGLRYLTEARVMVGHIAGREIWGSTDLLDVVAGMTVDWKLVGASTLKKAKSGPSPVYRTQADLYAKGWNDAGIRVDHVAIAYLPRNAVSLDDAIWWTAPHDRQRAVDALARAERIATNLAALTALGPDAVAAWISGLPRDPDCFDCARFPDGAHLTKPGHRPAGADLLGLIPQTPVGAAAGSTAA